MSIFGGSFPIARHHSSSLRLLSLSGFLAIAWSAIHAPVARAADAAATTSVDSPGAPPSTAGQAATTTLTEVVVTAEKRKESVMNVPIAMAALPGAALKTFGIQNTQDLQFAVPALQFSNTGAYAQSYIRGIGTRLLQNGLDPAVTTYIDGRDVSRQSGDVFDFTDIARIEVLEGPQGVLFGRNSMGGAIRVITNDVSKQFESDATASVGNYGAWSVSGMVNAPITDTLGMRLAVNTEQRGGIAQNLDKAGYSDWNNENFNEARGKLKWDPSAQFTAELTFDYTYRDDNEANAYVAVGPLKYDTGIYTGGITGVGPYQVATALKSPNEIRTSATELDLTYRLQPFDIKSITTYANENNQLTFDGDGTSAALVDATVYEKPNTFTQELDLTSNTEGPIDWLAGLYYFNDRTAFDTTVATGPKVTSNGNQSVRTLSYAGFAQVRWHLTRSLALIVGGRYTSETKGLVNLPSVLPFAITTPVTPYTAHLAENKMTPSVTLQYSFGESMVYAKYATGFTSGGFNYPAEGQPVLRPETLDMEEVGYKATLFHHALQLTTSAYYYNFSDLQVTSGAISPVGTGVVVTTTNAASAVAHGLDANVAWYAANRLTLNTSVSLEESEYLKFEADGKEYTAVLTGKDVPGMSNVVYDAKGQPLLHAPKFSAFESATYQAALGAAEMPVTVSYGYKSSFNYDFVVNPSSSVLRQGGYGVLNARIGYVPQSGSWSLAVYGDNLTNKRYFNDDVAAAIGIRAQYANPLTYGMEFSIATGE